MHWPTRSCRDVWSIEGKEGATICKGSGEVQQAKGVKVIALNKTVVDGITSGHGEN